MQRLHPRIHFGFWIFDFGFAAFGSGHRHDVVIRKTRSCNIIAEATSRCPQSKIQNRKSKIEKNPRTRRRTLAQNGREVAGSGQALLQHTGISTCGCFLPDLTGFGGISLSRTQPSTPRAPHLTKEQSALGREFDLAKADCEYRTPLVSRLARVKTVESGSAPHPFQKQPPP